MIAAIDGAKSAMRYTKPKDTQKVKNGAIIIPNINVKFRCLSNQFILPS
ncbi:hypothetical protein ACFLXT_05045 [Chloroflexota bacterium]